MKHEDMPSVTTGALPYSDGSGFEVEIQITPLRDRLPEHRIELNPDSEFCWFNVSDWPKVREAIDRAVAAHKSLVFPTSSGGTKHNQNEKA